MRRRAALFVVAGVTAAVSTLSGFTGGTGTSTRTYPAGSPPWFRGSPPAAAGTVAAFAVRVGPAPDGTPEAQWPRAALERLAADLTDALRGEPGLRVLEANVPDPVDQAPRVYLGCALDGEGPAAECDPGRREMELAITHPSRPWRDGLALLAGGDGAGQVVLFAVEVADHWLTQKNVKGAKEVPLGTGYAQPVPWLTSLDTPVTVLQLTAVLLDAEGKIVCSGVEGLAAVRTRFGESVLGLQRVPGADEIDAVRTGPRPAAALRALLAGLVPAPAPPRPGP